MGGFFAAVANSYITSSYLPDTGVMTLMDFVNLLGLVTIFLCMIQTVISSHIVSTDKDFSRLFDKISFGMIGFIYLGLNIALPLVAWIHYSVTACLESGAIMGRITQPVNNGIIRPGSSIASIAAPSGRNLFQACGTILPKQ